MMSIEEFCKYRDETIIKMDVEEFKRFYHEMVEQGSYPPKPLPSDHVIEISLRKMAMEIKTIPKETKDAAAEWLIKRGYSLYFRWY